MGKLKVTQIKSSIGTTATQRATLIALGLKKRMASVNIADNPANRGQVRKIQHLVKVIVGEA